MKQDNEFVRTNVQQQSYDRIKEIVSEDCLLRFYDPDKPLFIECDASKLGIGVAMLQPTGELVEQDISSDDSGKAMPLRERLAPVAYASKSLSDAETRYSNIERELLAVVFSLEHFKHFTCSRRVHVITDHKPLLPLFRGKNLTTLSTRLCRLMMRVTDYDVRIHYQHGKSMQLSDALSRLPSHNTKAGQKEEIPGCNITIYDVEIDIGVNAISQIQQETAVDPTMVMLKEHIDKGWPQSVKQCPEPIRDYYSYRHEISIVDGLILKGTRIIIPEKLRQKSLKVLHASHQGIEKSLLRARDTVFWPGISKDIKETCIKCASCCQFAAKQQKEPLQNVPEYLTPWSSLATDVFEYSGHSYLIVVDRFSKFIVVRELKDHSANTTIKAFLSIFREFGLPVQIRSDRGSNYTSREFVEFCRKLDIKLQYSSAEHHSSNPAERAVRTVKNIMKRCRTLDKGSSAWQIALIEYLSTPISSRLKSPAELLTGRIYRGLQPFLTKHVSTVTDDFQKEEFLARRAKEKFYHDRHTRQLPLLTKGQTVYFRKNDRWVKAVVVDRDDDTGRSYTLVTEAGQIVSRNRVDVKPCLTDISISFEGRKVKDTVKSEPKRASSVPKPSKTSSPVAKRNTVKPAGNPKNKQTIVTRSGRVVKAPDRLNL